MATKTIQQGERGSKSSWSASIPSNGSLSGTQQQGTHQVVHRNAANAGAENIAQDKYIPNVCKLNRSKNQMLQAIG
jgi:hypothetical protein